MSTGLQRDVYMEISETGMKEAIALFESFVKRNPEMVKSDLKSCEQPEKSFTVVLTDWFKLKVDINGKEYRVTEYKDNNKTFALSFIPKVDRIGDLLIKMSSLSVYGEKEEGYLRHNVPAFKFWLERAAKLAVSASMLIRYQKIQYVERKRQNFATGNVVDLTKPSKDIVIDLEKAIRTKPVSTGKGGEHSYCYSRSACDCYLKKYKKWYKRGVSIVHPEKPTRVQGIKTVKGLDKAELLKGKGIAYG